MINGQHTPLNLNCLGELLQNQGLEINTVQQGYMGVSTSNTTYTTRGTIYTNTLLDQLADITELAYSMIGTNSSTQISQANYDNLINMGSTTIPALGNSKPSLYTRTYSGEMTKYGWLRLIAYQAYNEFHVNGGNSYSDFLSTFLACDGFIKSSNSLIANYSNSTTYLKATYSNMSDLITSDITCVSLSTVYWGQDLIASGKVIDLNRISDFGLPSVLFRTLYTHNAFTASLNVALLSAGFTTTDINEMLAGPVSIDREKNLFAAFSIIVGNDLRDILIPLNCQTPNLSTLADLLNPKKLFPNSYQTLTYPKYNTTTDLPTNSRTSYRIYLNGEPDTGITPSLGLRLRSILPEAQACACDAFSVSMMQIKNIQAMDIQKFAQVVTNMENVVGLETGSANFPINPDIAIAALPYIAKGTGPNNTYNTCDFFGAITNLHYEFNTLEAYINSLNTASLQTIYGQIYTLLTGPGPYNTDLATYIQDANDEIENIQTNNTPMATNVNSLYSRFGEYLQKEQDARDQALPTLADISTSMQDLFSFMDHINDFAIRTQDKGPALVLESIVDSSTMGGNSLIGSMREVRNSQRLGLVGGQLDSGIDTSKLILPRITGTTARQSPIEGYTPNDKVADIPIVTGAATTPGSLAGSPEVRLIPPNLSVFNTGVSSSVLTPQQALDSVIHCNCSCWDNLQ